MRLPVHERHQAGVDPRLQLRHGARRARGQVRLRQGHEGRTHRLREEPEAGPLRGRQPLLRRQLPLEGGVQGGGERLRPPRMEHGALPPHRRHDHQGRVEQRLEPQDAAGDLAAEARPARLPPRRVQEGRRLRDVRPLRDGRARQLRGLRQAPQQQHRQGDSPDTQAGGGPVVPPRDGDLRPREPLHGPQVEGRPGGPLRHAHERGLGRLRLVGRGGRLREEVQRMGEGEGPSAVRKEGHRQAQGVRRVPLRGQGPGQRSHGQAPKGRRRQGADLRLQLVGQRRADLRARRARAC